MIFWRINLIGKKLKKGENNENKKYHFYKPVTYFFVKWVAVWAINSNNRAKYGKRSKYL